MKRLAYAPKVFAFINADRGLIDVSPDIVSGSVTRRINQASQAELVLRNKNMKYTEQGDPTFHPMDKITIYLQRLPNTPVQVFTGYLDTAPYLQLFPGNCKLTASCTLKRLLYTYFDQGLSFTGEYLRQYGWITNYATGQLENPNIQLQPAIPDPNNPQRITLNDGSIGELLFAVLRDIGKWDEKEIFIEQLPKELPQDIAKIYSFFQKENETPQKELQNFFSKIIGTAPSSGSGSGGADDTSTSPNGTGKLVPGQTTRWTASWFSDAGGSCGSNSQNGGMTFAELSDPPGSSTFKAMGGLPCGAFVKVTYRGKSVVVKKTDVGNGGSGLGGTIRGIDLWEKPARALGIASAGLAIVDLEPVRDARGTPYGGGAGSAGGVRAGR